MVTVAECSGGREFAETPVATLCTEDGQFRGIPCDELSLTQAEVSEVGLYRNLCDCHVDINMIWDNAIGFNGPGSRGEAADRQKQAKCFEEVVSPSVARTDILLHGGPGLQGPVSPDGPLEGWRARTLADVQTLLEDLRVKSWFGRPVDLSKYPIYAKRIHPNKPMDLMSVVQKLEQGLYRNLCDCHADINMIWDNAIRFNGPGSRGEAAAKRMRSTFNRLLEQHGKTKGLVSTPKQLPPALGHGKRARSQERGCVVASTHTTSAKAKAKATKHPHALRREFPSLVGGDKDTDIDSENIPHESEKIVEHRLWPTSQRCALSRHARVTRHTPLFHDTQSTKGAPEVEIELPQETGRGKVPQSVKMQAGFRVTMTPKRQRAKDSFCDTENALGLTPWRLHLPPLPQPTTPVFEILCGLNGSSPRWHPAPGVAMFRTPERIQMPDLEAFGSASSGPLRSTQTVGSPTSGAGAATCAQLKSGLGSSQQARFASLQANVHFLDSGSPQDLMDMLRSDVEFPCGIEDDEVGEAI